MFKYIDFLSLINPFVFLCLVRPTVAEKSKKIYCGINQTRTINCTVLRANPAYIRYSINGLSSSVLRQIHGNQHDLQYTFDITPTSIEQFRPFNVTANNSIGFDTCTYDLIHGGKIKTKLTFIFSRQMFSVCYNSLKRLSS